MTTTSNSDDPSVLLTVQAAAEELWGPAYTATDVNRLYRMIWNDRIKYTTMGKRRFIPSWQVDKLSHRRDTMHKQQRRQCLVKDEVVMCHDDRYLKYDARGIPVTTVCEKCEEEKLKGYRPEIFTDANYGTTEPVEEDAGEVPLTLMPYPEE